MIKIPLIEHNLNYDCCPRQYRQCILNILIELKPLYSLEIGTHTFQSASVWSYYIDKYQSEGKLITADIAYWNRGDPPSNVYSVMVYPHITNIGNFHGGIDVFYKDYSAKLKTEDSVEMNYKIIHAKMLELGIGKFDFVFVDGDHTKISVLNDLVLAKSLTKPDGFILLDDIEDENHPEQCEVYRQLKEKGNVFYEFEDWQQNTPVGMGLIQNKDLIL